MFTNIQNGIESNKIFVGVTGAAVIAGIFVGMRKKQGFMTTAAYALLFGAGGMIAAVMISNAVTPDN